MWKPLVVYSHAPVAGFTTPKLTKALTVVPLGQALLLLKSTKTEAYPLDSCPQKPEPVRVVGDGPLIAADGEGSRAEGSGDAEALVEFVPVDLKHVRAPYRSTSGLHLDVIFLVSGTIDAATVYIHTL
jgi:hypothetical protein